MYAMFDLPEEEWELLQAHGTFKVNKINESNLSSSSGSNGSIKSLQDPSCN